MISIMSFSDKDAEMSKNSFSKSCHRGRNVIRQTDATARHSNNDKEIICDFLFDISMFCPNTFMQV